jgi:outer membrane protein OmpA-like peptidoglycan-associated protein
MPNQKTFFLNAFMSGAILMSVSAVAMDGRFYLGGQIGQAQGDVGASEMNQRMADLGYDAQAKVSGQNRTAWGLFAGYEYSKYLAFEAGYVDLGEVRSRLSGSPVDIEDYLNSANLVHPRSADGYELALVGRYPFDEKNSIYVRGGILFAGSSYKADAQTEFAKRNSNGNDVFIGVGYAYEINDRWGLQISAQNYRIEDENIRLFGMGLRYKFGASTGPVAVSSAPPAPLIAIEEKPQPTTPIPQVKVPMQIKLAVQFDTNSDVVKDNYLQQISHIAELMKMNTETKVTIEGHTDDRGDANFNRDLSLRRAKAVRHILVEKFGIANERVASIGYGEERPIADNATAAGRELNRRVVAEISGLK